mgnify:CR=1 FL=1
MKPKKGRPPVDTEAVNLRLPRDMLSAVDAMRREQSSLPTRPEAIRIALKDWLIANGYLPAESGE